MPIGSPCLFNPNGQAVAGKPRTLIIAVYEKLNAFISGSWCNGAAVGWVGYKKTPSSPKISWKYEKFSRNVNTRIYPLLYILFKDLYGIWGACVGSISRNVTLSELKN